MTPCPNWRCLAGERRKARLWLRVEISSEGSGLRVPRPSTTNLRVYLGFSGVVSCDLRQAVEPNRGFTPRPPNYPLMYPKYGRVRQRVGFGSVKVHNPNPLNP